MTELIKSSKENRSSGWGEEQAAHGSVFKHVAQLALNARGAGKIHSESWVAKDRPSLVLHTVSASEPLRQLFSLTLTSCRRMNLFFVVLHLLCL